jgi:hypothetical protein
MIFDDTLRTWITIQTKYFICIHIMQCLGSEKIISGSRSNFEGNSGSGSYFTGICMIRIRKDQRAGSRSKKIPGQDPDPKRPSGRIQFRRRIRIDPPGRIPIRI